MTDCEQMVLESLNHSGPISLRNVFHIRAVLVCTEMVSHMLSSPAAIRLNLHPGEGVMGEFDALPRIVQDLRRAAARIAYELSYIDRATESPLEENN